MVQNMLPILRSLGTLIPTLALLLHLSIRTMTLHGLASSPVQQVDFFRVQSLLSVVPFRILVVLSIRKVLLVSIQIDRSFSFTVSVNAIYCFDSYHKPSNLLPFVEGTPGF